MRETHKKIGTVPPNWKGKRRSLESVEKSASKRRGIKRPEWGGKNCNFWKGGITPINQKIRSSLEFKLWRIAVFIRDNYTCQKCNQKGGDLQPHHIFNFSIHFNLRFAIDNGITFCKECHRKFHKKYGYKNNTLEQLKEFLI